MAANPKRAGNNAVAKVVAEGFEALKKERGQMPTLERMAKEMRVSIASLVGWKSGARVPSAKNAGKLARLLYPTEAKRRHAFVLGLEKAAAKETRQRAPAAPPDPLEALIGGTPGHLDVSIIQSGVLAARPGAPLGDWGFLSELIVRYCSNAGLHCQPRMYTWEEGLETLKSGRIEGVLTGIVATADRLKYASFFATPLTVPVNAVIPAGRVQDKRAIREALRGNASRRHSDAPLPLRLFTFQDEIGELYVRRTLGAPSERLVREDSVSHKRALETTAAPGSEGPIVVIVADEITCGRIIKCGGGGDLLFRPEDEEEESFFPSYLVGFAANRLHRDFSSFFGESFELFLAAEETWVTMQMRVLAARLREELVLVRARLPDPDSIDVEKWAMRLLGIEHVDNESLSAAWRGVLRRFKSPRPSESSDMRERRMTRS